MTATAAPVSTDLTSGRLSQAIVRLAVPAVGAACSSSAPAFGS